MVKIAFYKDKRHLFNRAVAWWTRGPYSHCELIIDGISYSSSIGDGGVRSKVIDYREDRWDIYDLPWVNSADAKAWFEQHIGQSYDILGLVGFIIRRINGRRTRFFCSEACAESIGLTEGWRFDPNTLASIVKCGLAKTTIK